MIVTQRKTKTMRKTYIYFAVFYSRAFNEFEPRTASANIAKFELCSLFAKDNFTVLR